MVDDEGKVEKGPSSLKNVKDVPKSLSKNVKVSSEMKPNREDYDYESGDDRDDWVHKNVKKLQALYDEGGSKAIDDEWYKFRMADSTKDIHQMSKDEADEVVYDCPYLTQSLYDGWFRNADSSYKPKLTDAIVSSPEMRSAAMSLAYENYRNNIDEPMSFRRFLTTPIKVYRGERGQKHIEDDVFDAYTFDRKMAEHFSGPNGTIIETEVRPIDTFGSMRAVGEAEIWIPRNLSPVKRTDGVDARRIGDWEWKDPVKWAFEDFTESGISETDFSINEDALDSIIRDCEMIELFLSSKSESDKKIAPDVVDRCIDSIQRSVKQMTAFQKAENEDGAFFAGELDSDLGEKEKLYPDVFNMDSAWDEWLEEHIEDFESDDEQIKFRDGEWGGFKPKDASAVEEVDSAWDAYKKKKRVDRFRERRQKRLDAKEEPAAWITVNGNHIPVDEEGNPVGGQKKALGKSAGGKVPALTKKRINQSISEIVKSDKSDKEKIEAIRSELSKLPKGSKVQMPDSWENDNGTIDKGVWDGQSWVMNGGKGKYGYHMSMDDLLHYMNIADDAERPQISSVAHSEETQKRRALEREYKKDKYRQEPNGGPPKNYRSAYSSEEEYREVWKSAIEEFDSRLKKAEDDYNSQKEKIEDKYGSFTEQRFAVRHNENLTEEEKENKLREIEEARKKRDAELDRLTDKKAKERSAARRELYSHYDPDYDFKAKSKDCSLREDVLEVNPRFFDGLEYRENCTHCGLAFEMRCRGYDVEATPVLGGETAAGFMFRLAFSDYDSADISGGHQGTIEIVEKMREWGDGARAIINTVPKYGGEAGHTYNVINRGGNIIFVDSQDGLIRDTDAYGDGIYGGRIEKDEGADLIRVDQSKIYEVPEGWIKNK